MFKRKCVVKFVDSLGIEHTNQSWGWIAVWSCDPWTVPNGFKLLDRGGCVWPDVYHGRGSCVRWIIAAQSDGRDISTPGWVKELRMRTLGTMGGNRRWKLKKSTGTVPEKRPSMPAGPLLGIPSRYKLSAARRDFLIVSAPN